MAGIVARILLVKIFSDLDGEEIINEDDSENSSDNHEQDLDFGDLDDGDTGDDGHFEKSNDKE